MNKHYFKTILKLVLGIIAFISIMHIIYYFYGVYSAQKQSSLLNDIVLNEENYLMQDSNINTPVENNIETKAIEKNERMLKVEELQKENPELIGWLEIAGTVVNYPVMQGSDNDFYVYHNYEKKKAESGSLFIDSNFSWEPRSSNLMIYGHNMKNGTMFTSLLNYKSKNYYNLHPDIRFTTADNDATYEIIAVFESKVYASSDLNTFKYYNFINARDKEDYDNFIYNVKKLSIYDTGKTAVYGENLMTLSTCAYHIKNGRFAVVAKEKSN